MGQVVYLNKAERAAPQAHAAAEINPYIQESYEALTKATGFITRPGQQLLSQQIFESLVKGVPLAAEAPTGTGKTIAYLIAALAAQKERPDPLQLPIVVATATVGLQHQILTGDLPRLYEAGVLGPDNVVLAKGRGRYFCSLAAERAIKAGAEQNQEDFFDEKVQEDLALLDMATRLRDAFDTQQWDGDRDHLQGDPPEAMLWSHLKASTDTCISRRCAFYDQCAFYRERARLAEAQLVIANHDLVLADLQMATEDSTESLFPMEKYLLVADEGHHLPNKALDVGATHVEIEEAQIELSALPGLAAKFFKTEEIGRLLENRDIAHVNFEPGPATLALAHLAEYIRKAPVEPGDTIIRLGRKPLPDDLVILVKDARERIHELEHQINRAINVLRNTMLPERLPHLQKAYTEVLYQAGFHGTKVRNFVSALDLFLETGPRVRWLDHDPARARLHVSPLEGADVLRELLWNKARAIPVLVSATLKTFNSFQRFAVRSGLPERANTFSLEPIFDYKRSALIIAHMDHSPRQNEREEYEQALSRRMPQFVRENEAVLALFPSIRLLKRVVPILREHFGEAVLVQGEMTFSRLVAAHKERCDEGRTSVLCGLATLAEGLDLPGHYCTHVMIAALPFAVPTNPVEMEVKDQLGDRYFVERALPDAMTALTQMVGRLIRREQDQGRITVFDNRLMRSRWGREMLTALPPFEKRKERFTDLRAAAARSVAAGW